MDSTPPCVRRPPRSLLEAAEATPPPSDLERGTRIHPWCLMSLLLMRSVGASLPVSAACARTGGASRDQSVRERLARRRWLV